MDVMQAATISLNGDVHAGGFFAANDMFAKRHVNEVHSG